MKSEKIKMACNNFQFSIFNWQRTVSPSLVLRIRFALSPLPWMGLASTLQRTCNEGRTDLEHRFKIAYKLMCISFFGIIRKMGWYPCLEKKLKVFGVGGFTLYKNRLLRIDYQWFMMGETLYKWDLLFMRGFTLCYFLIINVLYCKNGMGETPYLKNFWFFYIRLLKNCGNV